jgi:hypothetical protein
VRKPFGDDRLVSTSDILGMTVRRHHCHEQAEDDR